MSDRFSILPLRQLLSIILAQLNQGQLFGIPQQLFFKPSATDPFRHYRFGQLLETPIGVAAGPHTQLAQNIVCGWLCGARFMELKTIQTLDELEVAKPCIDMQDEGYNCEWSQELKVHESFDQYLNAWILIHILKDKLGLGHATEPGFIFNMSVGYDYQGIQRDNVQWFLAKMANASEELESKLEGISNLYPGLSNLEIGYTLSDNITLSTMHGCPPDEIEKIGAYFLQEKGLHTAIKLNPTLLGKEELHKILKRSGFETEVPDSAFEHDISYSQGVKMIHSLRDQARKLGLEFSLKLTNTLECQNNKKVFPQEEKMMYLSGRALHPISVRVADNLQQEFRGELDLSFSAGADAFNTPDLVASGLYPVTICSDLLKPGGYGRLQQYIDELKNAFTELNADSIESFILHNNRDNPPDVPGSAAQNLSRYVEKTAREVSYQKTNFKDPSIKTDRPLGYFDCVHAPCVDTCPTEQDIPSYLYHTARGDFIKASDVILQTNPFPNTTGMVCDHICQLKCTRINYDSPVLIREIKRFVAEQSQNQAFPELSVMDRHESPPIAGIIGAGPSGLSCASFLAKAGFEVNVYETKPMAGGMVSGAIPEFRLKKEAILTDIKRIEALGVKVHYTNEIGREEFHQIREESDYVFIATGAQHSKKLHIEGADSPMVLDPLDFLTAVKEGASASVGHRVIIIGAGNTAMDAARTAKRLVGAEGQVTIVYRRTKKLIPADVTEIKAVEEEGVHIITLATPKKINRSDDGSVILVCSRMKLAEADEGGRPRPVEISGSEFEIQCDTVIPAIGQDLSIDFVSSDMLHTRKGSYEIQIPKTFIGGDALRGAASIIEAIGDGRKVAQEIIDKAGIDFDTLGRSARQEEDLGTHISNRAKRIPGLEMKNRPADERIDFNLVTHTMSPEEAMTEASRCLLCDEVCNVCVGVCPNLALHPYQTEKKNFHLQKISFRDGDSHIEEDRTFEVNQVPQILHLADWCNECGNCTTFCPSSGTPYKDKPHYFFNKNEYNQAREGFFLQEINGNPALLRKRNNIEEILTEYSDHWIYEIAEVIIKIEKQNFSILDHQLKFKPNDEITLESAAEMSLILPAILSFTQPDQSNKMKINDRIHE